MEVKGIPAPVQSQENPYELVDVNTNVRRNDDQSREATASWNKGSKQSTWSTPLVVIAVLQCLMVLLLMVILCLSLVQLFARDTTSTSTTTTGAIAGNNGSPNFTQWANDIVSRVNQSLPDFNEWANGVSQNTLQLFQNNTNFTELDEKILQTTRDSAQKLISIVNTLSNLQDTSTSTAGVTDDILLIVLQRLVLQNGSLTSCKQLKSQYPSSPSGYYVLASANGSVDYSTYCNMGTLCGSGGGWTRLAYLDMSDATQNCPSGFRLYQSGGVRACGRPVTNSGSCVSVQFPSNGISYSQICGRVFGHSYNTPDAVNTDFASNNHNNINSYYVDGVSITRGSPRQHVWTLMATGADSFGSGGRFNCPCVNGSVQVPQAFVGNHYFCEGGNDLLWDGKGCSSDETLCCSASGLPWFHRDYGSTTTTDYIELRVCADQETTDEDVPVSFYEIYIK